MVIFYQKIWAYKNLLVRQICRVLSQVSATFASYDTQQSIYKSPRICLKFSYTAFVYFFCSGPLLISVLVVLTRVTLCFCYYYVNCFTESVVVVMDLMAR